MLRSDLLTGDHIVRHEGGIGTLPVGHCGLCRGDVGEDRQGLRQGHPSGPRFRSILLFIPRNSLRPSTNWKIKVQGTYVLKVLCNHVIRKLAFSAKRKGLRGKWVHLTNFSLILASRRSGAIHRRIWCHWRWQRLPTVWHWIRITCRWWGLLERECLHSQDWWQEEGCHGLLPWRR